MGVFSDVLQDGAGNQVKLGIDAPEDVAIVREELLEAVALTD
ncbi:carbon storage regulator [Halieaceae bacterium IMCC14734]|uniref:Carbon storage regulator n=1 Tax=Candidatus Litorirhabdus singularis TaxID=2518993 RepID=A0ABT3TPY0_9GAMM|nr:carbon storage regulator [Candidatus Litorirhabdus singularis]